jgi:hypothetical protein
MITTLSVMSEVKTPLCLMIVRNLLWTDLCRIELIGLFFIGKADCAISIYASLVCCFQRASIVFRCDTT